MIENLIASDNGIYLIFSSNSKANVSELEYLDNRHSLGITYLMMPVTVSNFIATLQVQK